MKKAAITFITSVVLAFALPLYAADAPGMKSDSQQKAGVTQQRTDQMRYGQMQYGQMQYGQMQSSRMITADELQGMEIVSTEGEEIGKINTINIDKESGEVKFVTFSKGGILGMGAEEVAVPLSAFEFRDEKARLTVDQSKLNNVPRQSAGVTDSDYLRDLETHYGAAPAWDKGNLGDNQTQRMDQRPAEPRKVGTYDEPGMKSDSQQRSGVTQPGARYDSQHTAGVTQQRSDQMRSGQMRSGQMRSGQMQSSRMITADELEGMEIVSTEGEDIGKINTINIDKQSGEVKFVTFSKGGVLGMGAEEVAVPLSAFDFRDEKARLTVDQSKLDNVPRQSAGVADSDYLRELETHYGVGPAWDKGNLGDPNQTQRMDQRPAEPRKVDDASGMKSDSQQRSGVTQPGVKADSQQRADVTQPGVKADSQQRADVTQPGMKADSQQRADVTQPGVKADSQQRADVTQPGMKADSQQRADVTQPGMKADSQRKAGVTQQRTGQMQSGKMITADELQGMEIVSTEGEEIGKINTINIDKQSGEVKFVTFSKGGTLGMGAEEVAVPLSAFEFRDEKARLTVDQSKLNNVPRQSAGVTDSDYLRDLETHYGVAPAWDTGVTQPGVKADAQQRADATQPAVKADAQPKASVTQPAVKADAQPKAGVTQPAVKADAQPKAGVTQPAVKADAQPKAGAAQPTVKADAQPKAGAAQPTVKADAQPKASVTQPAVKADAQPKAGVTQPAVKADAQPKAGVTQQRTDQMHSGQVITAAKLQGMAVVSKEGEEIGNIKKVGIDEQSGEVNFITFSKGGTLGRGAEEVAAPLSAFEIRDEKARLTVDQSKLNNVPRQSAGAADSDYLRDLETHYGVAPAWEKGTLADPIHSQRTEQNPDDPRN